MNNDLINRKWLTDAIRNRRTYLSYEDAKDVIDLIDNAPNIEAFTKEDMAGAYNEGYACGGRESKRPQGEWIVVSRNCWKCPFCQELTNEGKNYCSNCGASMKGGVE